MLAYYQSAEAQQTPQTQSTMAVPNRLVVVSRDGTARPIELPERTFSDPRVSPDGTRLVVHGSKPAATTGWPICGAAP